MMPRAVLTGAVLAAALLPATARADETLSEGPAETVERGTINVINGFAAQPWVRKYYRPGSFGAATCLTFQIVDMVYGPRPLPDALTLTVIRPDAQRFWRVRCASDGSTCPKLVVKGDAWPGYHVVVVQGSATVAQNTVFLLKYQRKFDTDPECRL